MIIDRKNKKKVMKETANIMIEKHAARQIRVSFEDHEALQSLKFDFIRQYLKDLITKRDTVIDFDLNGIYFMDNEIIDFLNFLYRLGRKYNSQLKLKNVGPETLEIINLAKKYYIFDIKQVEPVPVEV